MNSTTTTTLYFFKGTAFPVEVKEHGKKQEVFHRGIVRASVEMITLGLKMGESKETQIKDYLTQLTQIEDEMCRIEKKAQREGWYGTDLPKAMRLLCETFGETQDKLMATWCININALIVLKALTNDDNNGVLFSKMSGGRAMFM